MKTNIYLTALLGLVIQVITYGQSPETKVTQDPTPFNLSFWTSYAEKLHLSPTEQKEFITSHQRTHVSSTATPNNNSHRPINNQNQLFMAGPCVNIDFEGGNLNGWAPTCGWHPLFNPLGCCPNPGGQQLITTGGLDPAGNFPMVAPGGNFSLRLGDNINGGEADRIEQTFFVTPANANFQYKYAVVFEDPGHTPSQQPAFQVEMRDTLGNPVPCTFYNVVAGGGIPGFFNSLTQPGVLYKPWSTVMADLTSFIGQNITIRFSTYDCALGGHFGYAYIDGSCQSFVSGTSDTICSGGVKNYCAPGGVSSYQWNGPGIVNNTNQCINATAAGIYTCQTTLMNACPGPVFTYTLSYFPNPVVSFNQLSLNACAQQYTFTNTSTIAGGFIASYNWNFGGNNISPLTNPVYTFPTPGTYTVTLTATSNHSCQATTTQNLAIYPYPVASFASTNICQSAVLNFTNNSYIPTGTITTHNWTFGNGNNSNLINPSQNYANSGNYVVSLTVTSNQNCSVSTSSFITIYPMPNVVFTANNSCFGTNTNFTNSSNIISGNINTYVWDFDNNGQPNSFQFSPSYVYPAIGTFVISLSAVSNFNCVSTSTAQVNVYPNPVSSFSVSNACYGKTISFTNQSTIANGNQITSYSWNFGNNTYTSALNPQYNYGGPGTYTVTLTATSNNNCMNTYTSTATAYHIPNVNFTSNNACHNQSTQFVNSTVINAGSIAKWRWDYQNDGIWDDTLSVNPANVYATSGNFNCKMQAVSNFNCPAEKTNPVIVYANPVANFINKPVCLGDVSTFTNTSTSADGAIQVYQWDFDGDNQVDNVKQNPSYTYTTNGIYLLKLEVQTEHGCVNIMSKSMYVNPKPNPAFSVDKKSGCPSLCVAFTNSSTIATGSIKAMQWTFGDGSTPSHELNPSHCYNPGNYDGGLILMSDSGCISVMTKPSMVTVYPNPVAGFHVEPEEVDENEPIINVSTTATGANQTVYFLNDQFSTLLQNFDHRFKSIDKVKPLILQVVRNEYNCADSAYKVLDVKPSFVVYIPNTFTPNGDGVNDGWFAKGVGISKFSVQVFDRWGHVIFETADIEHAWDGKTKGSTEPIMQDVYVWRANVVDVFNKNHELAGTVTIIK